MEISQADKKRYRAIGHRLKPVVTIAGKGLNASVCHEIDRALSDHELIKIRVSIADRDLKNQTIQTISDQLKATLVQTVGHTALIFRAAEKPDPRLSNLTRQP